MKLTLDWRKGARENAEAHYLLSKELAKKAEGARKAIEETKKEIAAVSKEKERADAEASAAPEMKRKKEWFEKYRWFYTSGKRLVVAGRDAKQNDLLVSKVMADGDLFFHADIQGAPATILQDGKNASTQEKNEAAQFAASHSSAWKIGAAGVDVYAVGKSQLSKHVQGGHVGAGGFAIEGEREWFRSTALGLAVGAKDGIAIVLPIVHIEASSLPYSIFPGAKEKGAAAKELGRAIPASPDEVLLALPSGKFAIKRRI
ncbi:MAG: NFACT RNA binding domain-containing protein [Candidatus Micrarchaeota archaeon]|nr:NFACT RNA binding domain-containing protein [Candidatus Micrarchaeota archaeon]